MLRTLLSSVLGVAPPTPCKGDRVLASLRAAPTPLDTLPPALAVGQVCRGTCKRYLGDEHEVSIDIANNEGGRRGDGKHAYAKRASVRTSPSLSYKTGETPLCHTSRPLYKDTEKCALKLDYVFPSTKTTGIYKPMKRLRNWLGDLIMVLVSIILLIVFTQWVFGIGANP